jgi:preprotein translocase subunit SecE
MAAHTGRQILVYAKDERVMADKVDKANRTNKTSPAEFIRQVQTEGRKVVWPTREETVRTAIFVFIMMVILSLFFLGIDSVFSTVVRWLLTLA